MSAPAQPALPACHGTREIHGAPCLRQRGRLRCAALRTRAAAVAVAVAVAEILSAAVLERRP